MRAMLGAALVCALVVSAAVAADQSEPPATNKPVSSVSADAHASNPVLVLGVAGVTPGIAIVTSDPVADVSPMNFKAGVPQ